MHNKYGQRPNTKKSIDRCGKRASIMVLPELVTQKTAPPPSKFEGVGAMLYFVLSFGLARTGRRSKPLPCGRHSHAMLAKDKGHALGQVGREQGVDVVVQRGVGYGEQFVLRCNHFL